MRSLMAFAAVIAMTGGAMADTLDSPVRPHPVPRRDPVRQLTDSDAARIAAAQAKRERKAMKRAARPQGESKQ